MHKLLLILTFFVSTTSFAFGPSSGDDLPNSGKVLEAIQTDSYSYLRVSKGDKEIWVAVNHLEVKEEDFIRYSKGTLMKNFNSKVLNRVFPEILFAGKAAVEGAHPTVAEAEEMLDIQAAAGQLGNEGKVVSTIPSNAYTYVEVDIGGQTEWLAVPRTELKNGATIRYGEGAVMTNFYSKKLDREFPKVLFLGGVQVIN